MSAGLLLGGICVALLLQLIAGFGVVALRSRARSANEDVSSGSVQNPPVAASRHPNLWASLHDSLLRREVFPFLVSLVALAAATLLIDAVLHVLEAVRVGRYLGIPGVILIIASFGYSLRKRKLISVGQPVTLLRLHERMAWAGSLLILVHAGIHFNSILAWLAVWAMLVNVASGLTGKFLLQRARRRLEASRTQLLSEGLSVSEVEERLFWDSLTLDIVKKWRVVHIPITLAFAVLATAHILAVFLFWGWK